MPTSSTKLQQVLRRVDDKTAELAALRPMKPEYEARLWEKFRLEWNYASNHIEGNTLTYGETKLLLIFDQLPTEPHTLREVEEMKAHDVAVALVREWAAEPDRELTEADIRALNKTILVRPFWKEALTPDGQPTRREIAIGKYKKHPNSVRLANGEMFNYTDPNDVIHEMGELMNWYRTEGQDLHPAVAAALFHYRFVRIHPFDDGNGRISRLLLNYHLLRKNLPPVVIRSEDKRNYLFALQKADAGDQDAFCGYVTEQLLWSLELSIRAARGESVEEAGDWEKYLQVMEKSSSGGDHVQKISNEVVFQRLSDSVLPLIKYLSERLSKVDKLFAEVEPRLGLNLAGQYYQSPPNDLYEKVNELYTAKKLEGIQSVSLGINWSGFLKKPDQTNNVSVGLTFEFQPFLYKVSIPGNNKFSLSKNYPSAITAHEQDEIVNEIGKFVTEQLQQNQSR